MSIVHSLAEFATRFAIFVMQPQGRRRAIIKNKMAESPDSPELNPTERIFEEIRRHIEGIIYLSLSAKQYRIDHFLRWLRADKERLRQLVTWDWIENSFQQLPITVA